MEQIELFKQKATVSPFVRKIVTKKKPVQPLTVAGLFSGIGGIELGFARNDHKCELFCEIDEGASEVLRNNFPTTDLISDIRDIDTLPKNINCITGGFPCQDLSQAGNAAGIINGRESSLVGEIFRILKTNNTDTIILENVPFMLTLDKGSAMNVLSSSFEFLGYNWAYRVVDSICFGVPQRRQRVVFIASKIIDPRQILFADDANVDNLQKDSVGKLACGFYWTEGLRGLGWAVDAVPPIKGGSTVGIPSPPAICMPDGMVGTPDIRDAERMQGFPADWTKPATKVQRDSMRWKLVGNAVTVDVFSWIGARLRSPGPKGSEICGAPLKAGGKWPSAGWNAGDGRFGADFSYYPTHVRRKRLDTWLNYPLKPLSKKATAGFLSRASRSSLHFPQNFLDHIKNHYETNYS